MPKKLAGVPPGSPLAAGAGQTGKTVTVNANAPHPHRNLGPHLKAPKDGEYVTTHHHSFKKATA